MDFLLGLKESYSLILISVIVAYLLMKIESIITGKVYSSGAYIKSSVLVSVVSGLVVYIHNLKDPLPIIDEEIMPGPPPF
jgi:glucan phosphoethanolaminetransferase (alkaline phosphatase superfamily)